jgi:outer membrane protein TolC
LYKLRSQINTCYFNLLLLKRKRELLNNYLELIGKRIESLQSALSNGVITKSDIDVLTSEKINLIQQLSENETLKGSLLKILSSLTGSEIDSSTELILPAAWNKMTRELSRPELELYDLRKEQLSAGLKVLESKRMPKAFGFATVGYGNPPGNNFFKDEFAPYYMIGASIKWNIFDWNKTRNEKQLINLQQVILENRKSDLTENLNRLLEAKNAEIVNLNSMLESDTALIAIRKRITGTAESQYENGTITATEFLNALNSERQAMINYEIHKINLTMVRIEYLNISGKEIE